MVILLMCLAGVAGQAGAISTEPLDEPAASPAPTNVHSIHRLYLAYFNREPDAAGLWFWVDRFAEGTSLRSIADQFAKSPEYIEIYGQLDDAAFIDQVYVSVLGRLPDGGGRSHWLGRLSTGLSRGELVVAFSESTEYQAKTGFISQPAIRRLYQAVFLRVADPEGLRHWLDQTASGRSLADISNAMVQSDEFVGRYGQLTNADLVTQIYANVLEREPDPAGAEFWLAELNGTMTRGDVVAGFASSDEFVASTGLVDPDRPHTPDRPAVPIPASPSPIDPLTLAPIPVITIFPTPPFVPQRPPFVPTCSYAETEVELTPLTNATYELRLRFQYIEIGGCGENLEAATVEWSGPEGAAWQLQPGFNTYFYPVHYGSVRFIVPAEALTPDLELPYDVQVVTPGADMHWAGVAALPLGHDITFSMPEEPLVHAFEPITVDASVTVAANPAAPHRELTIEARIFGRCIVDTADEPPLPQWVVIAKGRGDITADVTMTVLPGRGSCALRVRVSNSPTTGQGDIERALHDGSVFDVEGDASCPAGVCTITMTVRDPLLGIRHSVDTWAPDDHATLSSTDFDPTPATGEHRFTVTHTNTDGFCLRHRMFESAVGWSDGTRCYEPSPEGWVEVPVPAH